jgi:hypothetical protein
MTGTVRPTQGATIRGSGADRELYDDASEDVRLYDDFDPDRRVATTPAQYGGAIWEPNFHRMRYVHHAVDDGPHVIVG